MFRRIDAVVAAGEDGNSAGHEGGAVGGGVYAAGEARNDAEAGLAEIARQPFRELAAGGGGVAGADNGDPGARECVTLAAHGDQRRRIIDHLQTRGVVGFSKRDQADAEAGRRFQFAFGVPAGIDTGGRGAATPRQVGHRFECCPGAAVVIDQSAEGPRSNIVASDELQPVEPLLVGQPHAFAARPSAHVAPIFPSLPFTRRTRLARCLIHSSTVRSAITSAPG